MFDPAGKRRPVAGLREQAMTDTTAQDVMTRDVLTARADWSIDRLADFFIDKSISGAPVLEPDGSLVGVVSSTDLAWSDPDLACVVAVWPRLPDAIKAGIVAMVKAIQ